MDTIPYAESKRRKSAVIPTSAACYRIHGDDAGQAFRTTRNSGFEIFFWRLFRFSDNSVTIFTRRIDSSPRLAVSHLSRKRALAAEVRSFAA